MLHCYGFHAESLPIITASDGRYGARFRMVSSIVPPWSANVCSWTTRITFASWRMLLRQCLCALTFDLQGLHQVVQGGACGRHGGPHVLRSVLRRSRHVSTLTIFSQSTNCLRNRRRQLCPILRASTTATISRRAPNRSTTRRSATGISSSWLPSAGFPASS